MAVEHTGENEIPQKLLSRRLPVGEAETLLFWLYRPRPFVMRPRDALSGARVHVHHHSGFFQRRPHRLILGLIIAAVFDTRGNLRAAKSELGVVKDVSDRMIDVED